MTQASQHRSASAILRNSLGLIFAAALALAPQPAFAQHGGGGGGGGSHGGGGGGGSHGGGGGSHASSGGGSHASSSGGGGAHTTSGVISAHGEPNSPAGLSPHAAGSSAATHVWYGPSPSGGKSTSAAAAPQRFAANNNTWQDPPAPVSRAASVQHFHNVPNTNAASARGNGVGVGTGVGVRAPSAKSQGAAGVHANTITAPRNIHPHGSGGRPINYYPYYPYWGYGYGSGLWWGSGFGCDPYWGFGCFGFGAGLGYGYGGGYGGADGYGYNGGGYGGADFSVSGGDYGAGAGVGAQGDMSSDASQQQGAGEWQNSPDNQTQAATIAPQQYPVLVLRDGSMYAVNDFWLEGGKLHYVTTYGGENSFDPAQLDMQRTVDENAKRGITFTLYPTPAPAQPLQPPAANDQQAPQD